MIVCSGVGAAHDHYRVARCGGGGRMVYAVVVHRWLEKVGVGFKPAESCGWLEESDVFQHYANTRAGRRNR